ncbi:MAG TPA: DUF433 domain-containing protein [Geminicoccaceae bacterium]
MAGDAGAAEEGGAGGSGGSGGDSAAGGGVDEIGDPGPTCVDGIIIRDPEILSGEPVFRRTRVAAATAFDHLEAGLPLEELLESWPTLRRGDVLAVLWEAHRRVLDQAA